MSERSPMNNETLTLALALLCSICIPAQGDTNNVLSIYFPSNAVLGMAKLQVAENRPAAVDSFVNLSSTNSPSPKMLEAVTIAGHRGVYWYHFIDDTLRAITASSTKNVTTNELAALIVSNAFVHVSTERALRWNGSSTNLAEFAVDIWQWTNQSIRLCSGVYTNETTLVQYDKTVFSPARFFTLTSHREAMQGLINRLMQ